MIRTVRNADRKLTRSIEIDTRIKFEAREYQNLITDFQLENPRCAVFADMGVGKTVATLTALRMRAALGVTDPVLIVAPLRVARTVWTLEVLKWQHLKGMTVMPILGSEAERRQALRYPAHIYTINIENLPWLINHLGDRWYFKTVVVDECTKLKSFRTRQGGERAKVFAQVAHTKVKEFVGLTGTPSPNGLIDLWGQMWFVDKGARLGKSFEAFRQRWFKPPNPYGQSRTYVPYDHSEAQIHEKLSDIVISIRAKDWFKDLKEPIINNIYVDLNGKARQKYDKMEEEFYVQLEGHDIEAANAAVKSGKLLQICNGAMYVDPDVYSDEQPASKEWKVVHDQKLEALEEVIEEAAGTPVLVSYSFRSDLARLLKAFPQGRELTDSTEIIDQWNRGEIPILFSHPASAGHGLNLQYGGNILCNFGQTWNLEHRLQIMERIGPVRQLQSGNNRPVFIHNIIARDTMDEVVLARTDGKKDVQDALLDAMRRRKEWKENIPF